MDSSKTLPMVELPFVRLRYWLLWVVALVFLAGGQPAVAQNAPAQGGQPQYKVLPVPAEFKDKRAFNQLRLMKQKLLSGSEPLEPNVGEFNRYYAGFFRMLTQPDDMHELPDKRVELARDFQFCRNNEAVHAHLTDLTLRSMGFLVRDNYHPAVRYNAMLIIGDLNTRDANPIQRQPAVPLPAARQFMLSELQNPEQIDAVRVGALLGLLRHAEAAGRRLPPAERQTLREPLLALVSSKQPPPGRTAEGHVWMQRRALDILAELGLADDDAGNVLQAIEAILADREAPLSLHCTAAAALGRLKPSGLDAGRTAELVRKLGGVAATACRQELARVDRRRKLEEEKAALEDESGFGGEGYGGMSAPGRMAGGGGLELFDPGAARDEFYTTLTRRRLKYQLHCVQLGITPLTDGAAQGSEPAKVARAIQALAAVTDQAELPLDELSRELRKNVRELETLTRPAAAAAPDAALPGDDLPGDDLPGDDLPGEDLPGEDLPGEDLPGDDLPGDDLPGDDLPGEDLPGEDLPGEDVADGDEEQLPQEAP